MTDRIYDPDLIVLDEVTTWDCSWAVQQSMRAVQAGTYQLHHLRTVSAAVRANHGWVQLWRAAQRRQRSTTPLAIASSVPHVHGWHTGHLPPQTTPVGPSVGR